MLVEEQTQEMGRQSKGLEAQVCMDGSFMKLLARAERKKEGAQNWPVDLWWCWIRNSESGNGKPTMNPPDRKSVV